MLLLGVLAVRVSVRLGLPSLLLYLGIGVLLGESVLGIRFDDTGLTESLGLTALVLILTEGGLTTRWSAVRPALGLGLLLSTLSVLVSIAVTGGLLHLLLDLEWRTALLWGAVLSSTDAAAVFSVLRGVAVPQRLAGTLELESGMNDAPVVIAVVVLAGTEAISWTTPLLIVYELVAGAVIGVLLGLGAAWALRRAALPSTGLYPLAAIASCLLAFAAGQGCTPPGCSPPTAPRWCWATPGSRTAAASSPSPRAPGGSPRSGCSCCSACTRCPRGCPPPWCPR